MQNQTLNPKQRKWLRLYLGRDERYAGNATACYKLVYECMDDRVAQSSGSRLVNHPVLSQEIAKWHAAQANLTMADAGFVLEQSIRLYDRAMGDAPIEVDVIDSKTTRDANGNKRTVHTLRTLEKREYNPGIARQALELIGRHTSVQAFQDNVEHTHTHRLEQALARRSKLVEARAETRIIEGSAQRIGDDDDQGHAVGEVKRGCIEAEVKNDQPASEGKTLAQPTGAQDE